MSQQQRRLQVLEGQLSQLSSSNEDAQQLAMQHTKAAEPPVTAEVLADEGAYAIPLPEHLTPEGSWQVYRCGALHMVCNSHCRGLEQGQSITPALYCTPSGL